MFVHTLADVGAAGRLKVQWNATVRSARYLTAADGMGFSLHDNRVAPGEVIAVWYKHHWEANYVVSGRGRVEDLGTGESWALEPGTLYNVGPKDRHRLSAETAMDLESVFCPPLAGDEQHDADGALAPSGPVPAGPPGNQVACSAVRHPALAGSGRARRAHAAPALDAPFFGSSVEPK